MIVFGIAVGFRGLRRWRLRDRGGDIVWTADPAELAIREGDKTITLAPEKLRHYRLERKQRTRFTLVSPKPKSSWSTDTRRTLCAVNGDPAIDRMQAALERHGVELRMSR